jgi:hypothetical protein
MDKPLVINKQYFSGAQASAFIGDVWVDDILAIDYSVQHTRLPQFGYGSQHYDFIPKGNIIVTGSFTVNFREPNYLWLILERYKKFNTTREARLLERDRDDAREEAGRYLTDRRQRFDSFFNRIDARGVKGNLVEQSREFNGISENNTKENFNHKTFDITIGYGYDLGEDSLSETISGIQIMGKGKVVNADGRPVQEQYNFIARRLI